MLLIRKKLFRIGFQALYYEPLSDKWYVSISNRTYYSIVEIPVSRVLLWKQALT